MAVRTLEPGLPDAQEPTVARWTSPGWRAEVDAWVRAVLAERAIRPIGPLEQHKLRPWSVVLSMQTDRGLLYLKQNCPGQNFEAALLAVLADVVPEQVLAPVALDPDRGLLLLPDGGPVLSTLGEHDLDLWCRVVAEWAVVQRELAPHVDRLVAAGVTAMPTEALPELARHRARTLHALPVEDPRRLDDAGYAEVLTALPNLERWSEQVLALGLPMSLDHNDLHANNAFVPRAADAPLRFFDLADSVLGDPLSSLLIPLNLLAEDLQAVGGDPRLWRVADAFLEVWSDLAPVSALRAALPASLQLARLHRHESYVRITPPMDRSELDQLGSMAGFWLRRLAADPPVVLPAPAACCLGSTR